MVKRKWVYCYTHKKWHCKRTTKKPTCFRAQLSAVMVPPYPGGTDYEARHGSDDAPPLDGVVRQINDMLAATDQDGGDERELALLLIEDADGEPMLSLEWVYADHHFTEYDE